MRFPGWMAGSCLAALAVVSCTSNNPVHDINKQGNGNPVRSIMAGTFSNLPNLGASGHYALFVRNNQSTLLIGTFRIGSDGVATDLDGHPLQVTSNGVIFATGRELKGSDRVFLTIEPEGDGDPGPNGPSVLSGEVFNDSGFINLDSLIRESVGANFKLPLDQAGAFYVMVTPSDNCTNPNNDNQGVHLVSQGLKSGLLALGIPPPNAPNMELGTLSNNLQYQAWVIQDVGGRLVATGGQDRSQARFLSVGTFRDVDGNTFDSDVLGPQAGTDSLGLEGLAQGWVGSDFVTQGPFGKGEQLTSGNWYVGISVEPVPDNDPAHPFAVILYRQIPAGAAAGSGNLYSLQNSFDVDNQLFTPPTASLKLLP